MAKVVVTYGIPYLEESMIAPHTLVAPPPLRAFDRAALARVLPDAAAVLACGRLDEDLIRLATKLQIIVSYGAGYDAIDVAAATRQGVQVANIPDTVTASTAELTVALMLALARDLPGLNADVRTRPGSDLFVLGQGMHVCLSGAALGVVGMGRIGTRVADVGRALGMRILYTAHAPKPQREALGDRFLPLDDLLRQSDVVTLHCPLTAQTRGLLDARRLALMKPTAYLINTARGALVVEEALLDALKTGRIAGAGLDVYPDEPNVNPAFFGLSNVVLTPHAGSNTHSTRRAMAAAAMDCIRRALEGREVPTLVNPEVRL